MNLVEENKAIIPDEAVAVKHSSCSKTFEEKLDLQKKVDKSTNYTSSDVVRKSPEHNENKRKSQKDA